jgi:acetyl esterase/lipase
MRKTLLAFVATLTTAVSAHAQLSETMTWAVDFPNRYTLSPNITYVIANNYESKLDVYWRRDVEQAQPTVIFIHGGGWVNGTKESRTPALEPWLAMGWNVVNVEYRLASVSRAPAAVEDCLCALKWVGQNATKYHIDTSRLVVTGESAGGHLALTTGMIPESAGLDRECPGAALPKVAAIVDWYGITDVADLLQGSNMKTYAVQWLGSQTDRDEIARRVSPLTYVRQDLPPVFIIHGDADPTVPYQHGVRLHQALDEAKVKNVLFTVPGGKHGGFSSEERRRIYAALLQFLRENKLAGA